VLTERFPYFFDEGHAACERRAAFHLAEGDLRARVAALGRAGLLREGRTDVRSIAVVRYQLAYRDALDDLAFIIQELGTWPLRLAGGFEAEVAEAESGAAVTAFALTEPEAGSDVKGIATVAEADGAGYRLTGVKHLISNAPSCHRATVFARLGDQVAAFLVDDPPSEAQAVAGHDIGRLVLDGTPARLVAPRGLRLALATLERCRPTVGAAAAGLARRGLDATTSHLRGRQQFGAPLARLPVVQLRVAEMAVDWETSLLATLHACWRRDTAPPEVSTGYESAVGKYAATEAAGRVLDQAVQLHGGAGVEECALVQRLWREARPLRIYEGASDVLLTLIARPWLE